MKAAILDELMEDFAPPTAIARNELLVGNPELEVTRFYVAWNPSQLDGIIRKSADEDGIYVAYLGIPGEQPRCLLALGLKGLKKVVVRCLNDSWRYHSWGVTARLARDLGLTGVRPVRTIGEEANYKLVTFLPAKDLPKVRESLFASGAGRYGDYLKCSFAASGKGTFLGSKSTEPAYGKAGRFEEIDEQRLEVIVPFDRLARAISALRKAHPYEEPVIEAYQVQTGKKHGEGRIGSTAGIDIREASRKIASVLGSQPIYMSGQSRIENVIVWDGDPAQGLYEAVLRGVDLYVGTDSHGLARIVNEAFGFAVLEFPGYCFTLAGAKELIYMIREKSKREAWGLRTFLPSKVGKEGVN